jgi:hypothetical protein
VKIKRVVLLVIVAVTFFSIGIYSQTTRVNPNAFIVPPATYSGGDLGFTVTAASTMGVEGFFVIRANGEWIPIPSTKQASGKLLQTN